MSSYPYAKLLVDLYEFPKQHIDTIADLLTENDRQVLEEAIDGLKNKSSGEHKQIAVYRSYGIGCEPVSLREIAASYEPPVTGGRAAEMRRTAWRHMRAMPVLRPLVERLVDAGLEGRWTQSTLRLPIPVELDTVNGVDDAQSPTLSFSGQFLFDCLPTCTPQEPCPTCKAKTLLQAHGLTVQFDEFIGEWQAAIGLGWQIVDIDSLGHTFSIRTANCLKYENIRTLGDLCEKTRGELLRTPNFGRKCLKEVEDFLGSIGKSLRT